jgi:dephospho-CoA kinase
MIFKWDVIAICGLKRSGKDVLARYIQDKYGYRHVKISTKLKEVVKTMFNLEHHHVEEKKDEIHTQLNTTPRILMDFLGTRIFQYEIQKVLPGIGRCFWIKSLLDAERPPIVISDLRFTHEVQELKNMHKCLIVRINRKDTSEDGLESEKECKEIQADVYIVNDSSVFDMTRSFDDKIKETIHN